MFKHAMMMSGGSSRFGYYLGIYAAFIDADRKPDAIFASCGGSIAAGIISAFDSIDEQKEALMSQEIYHMTRRVSTSTKHSLLSISLEACQRYFNQSPTLTFPDLSALALFEIENDHLPFFPFTPSYSANELEIVVIGSKLCFSPHQIGEKRADAPLFEEVIFSSDKTASAFSNKRFSPKTSLVSENITATSSVSLQDSIRISMSDIYYFSPYQVKQEYYMGGMLDLVPFELASSCSDVISLENKQPFSALTAVPAFNRLLGFDPNDSLRKIKLRAQDISIDTADSPTALKHHEIRKNIQWLSNRITLEVPTFDEHRKMMRAQWDYGYLKGQQALNNISKGKTS